MSRTPVPVEDVEPEELAALLDDEDVALIVDWSDPRHDPRSMEEGS